MRKLLKSYFAFASMGYCIVSLIVLPLLFLGMSECFILTTGKAAWDMLYFTWSYVVAFELLADVWLFGESCVKQAHEMEYLKTSLRGPEILKYGVIMDMIRRVLYFLLYAGIIAFQMKKASYMLFGMAAYIVTVGMLNVTRALRGVNQVLMVDVLTSGGFMGLTVLFIIVFPQAGKGVLLGGLGLLAVLAIAVSVFSIYHVMRCMKGDYYEEGSDKRN